MRTVNVMYIPLRCTALCEYPSPPTRKHSLPARHDTHTYIYCPARIPRQTASCPLAGTDVWGVQGYCWGHTCTADNEHRHRRRPAGTADISAPAAARCSGRSAAQWARGTRHGTARGFRCPRAGTKRAGGCSSAGHRPAVTWSVCGGGSPFRGMNGYVFCILEFAWCT